LPLASSGGAQPGQRVLYGIRPEHFSLAASGAGLAAEVRVIEPTGSETQVAARLAGQDIVVVLRERVRPAPGEHLHVAPSLSHVHLFDAGSGKRLS
jgi:multiple sugar transport system ATP-binding protein